jgi:PAS domain S-box-containing protein
MNDSEKTGTAAETRILVVDDDRNAAMYIADLLKTSDYAVSVCHSGAEALDFVQKNPVDLVLLDIMMPGMDGFETSRQMRTLFGKSDFVPIIFLSALGGQQEKVTGLRHADDFITKPFHSEELLARIRVMLRIRELQSELLGSKRNYEFLYENAPHMYVTINESRTITDCNALFCSRTGTDKAGIMGTSFYSFFEPLDHKMIAAFLDFLANEKVHPPNPVLPFINKKSPSEAMYVSLSAVGMESRGLEGYFMVAMQDVTQNVKLEQEQKFARSQLYRSARLASIGTFASGVAHELNNPLTAILGFSGAILERIKKEEDLDKEELGQYMSIINAETLRCRDTVENLSRFAREGDVQIRNFTLAECVGGALRLVKAAAAKKQVALVEAIAAGTRVRADLQKLQQAVVYILTNSLDFCGSGNSVSISCENEGRFVRLKIADNGPGIPADVLPKVFDPFFTTKQVGQGMGLGLAMSHVIMEECNGAIDVTSEPGNGTTVTLDIPSAGETPDGKSTK